MPRVHRVSLALLLTLAILAIAGPAAAHIASPAPSAVVLPTAEAPAIIPVLSAAPAPPARPWYLFAALAAALALVAGALWRRPRGALVVALTLLLCVFAFEHALHSVHHGFDPKQQEECTVAAASAHLAAVQVDDLGLSSVVLPVIGRTDAAPPASTLARFLSPDQGRAPPSAIL
jgi:fumarate reductase subunit D